MAHGTKDDIDTVGDEDPRSKWPKTAEAAKMAGVSKRTLENMVRSGSVDYVYDESGERHFNPSSLRENAGVISDADVEVEISKLTFDAMRRTNTDLVKANGDLLRLATEPHFKLVDSLQKELENMRTRYETLQGKYLSAIEAFESALTTKHERDLAIAEAKAKEARLDAGFNMAIGQLPNLIAQLTFKSSIDKLFKSFTPEQTSVLFDLLTPEQKAVVMNLMKQPSSGNGVSQEHNDDN